MVFSSYHIVDTGVTTFYGSSSIISAPKAGDAYFGQDAQYQINSPSYTDNTGLIWQKMMDEKLSFDEVLRKSKRMRRNTQFRQSCLKRS
ncbi:MAG: hypothetical protein CO186_03765 [Zetaproteobacteria bacterium CG_4_9_14_3_um_filter_49_83]|nr:MAG: hypothetical protein AUJ56_01435 [Zetaproteobacteria bacterium CG1_02_49_23]PIQ31001.1 MAG: hypothetical protein COW62_10760 [Zetaproteobacteria bacterium CG17_big_fil_post_rev_8_21_14_2_50_50_13]PIV30252.1 MAG: hypothetical protein COS35_07645 [Zetaproteobacteria bacterium CG02_land_8_20_14_3_00_50_9]PIY56886.1 MAG: hypothetical protein COZ00_01750 [Zetaproteobacteria bacterium CG_4_10_14_0_8_um_filter_49_80]PJA35858.1 MAG: hypothetical protein CO186_03765 [Zetaproteobacteria bacterium